MMTLFDEERIIQTYAANKAKEAAKEVSEKAAANMLRTGKVSVEEIAAAFAELSVEDVQRINEKLMQTV